MLQALLFFRRRRKNNLLADMCNLPYLKSIPSNKLNEVNSKPSVC